MINRKFAPGIFLSIYLFLFFLIISIILGNSSFDLPREVWVYAISIVIVVCFLYAVGSWYVITGQLFDPYVLFLVAAMLFTGGQALIEIFKIEPAPVFNIYNKVHAKTVLSALFLVSLGLLSFQSGGLVAALQHGGKKAQVPSWRFSDPNRVQFVLRTAGWLLLLLSFVPAISQLRTTINTVISGGYWAVFQIDRGIGLEGSQRVLSLFLVPGILFLLAGSKGKLFPLLVSALLIFSYVTIQFFVGSRMLAMMPLLAYAWLWHRVIHPLPRRLLFVSALIIGLVVFPLVSRYRTTAGDIRIATPSLILQTFTSIENPLVSSLTEMASTIYTVAQTLELVPSVRPFGLGSSYYYSLFSLVPNLFWSANPSSANELAKWFSWTVSPGYAAYGGGWGYSFVAEAYLNFGWIGMPIILMLLGYFYARFVLWASSSFDLAKMAFLASFSSFFYLFARGEIASMPRYFFWYSLLPYLLVIASIRFMKRYDHP
jgi:oligosaccharide repeat unit polymerase